MNKKRFELLCNFKCKFGIRMRNAEDIPIVIKLLHVYVLHIYVHIHAIV